MLWYVIFIILMYLLYPVLFSFEKLSDKPRKILFSCVIVFPIIAELLIAVFIPEILQKYDIDRMITRIPIFAFGAYMGRAVERGGECKKRIALVLVMAFFVLRALKILIWGDSLFGKPFVRIANQCLAIAVIMIAAMFFESFEGKGVVLFLRRMFSWCGNASLEIYLVHTFLILIYLALPLPKQWYMYFVVVVPFSFLIAAFFLRCKKKYVQVH